MRAILLGAFAAAALACGSDSDAEDAPYELTGPFAIHEGLSTDASNAALLTGTLALQDGCLYIDHQFGRQMPVFPRDTRWNEPNQSITIGAVTVAVGQAIGLGGGEGSTNPGLTPAACQPSGNVWIGSQLAPQ